VEFIQVPQLFVEDIVICNEQVNVLLSATGTWFDDLLWEDGSMLSDTTISSSGTYTIEASNSCFSISDSATVTYVFFPDSFVDSIYSVCALDTAFIITDYELGNILWSNGDTGRETGITGEGEFSVEIEYLGCESSDQFTVDRIPYIDVESLIMPNIFTPNEDTYNEVFRPFIPETPELNPCGYETLSSTLTIYNRWGNELHRGPCLWDGKTKNLDSVSDGTYYYLINLYSKCLDYESANQLNGSLEILR
jgi:gliding motility-associated-like protein